MGQIVSRDAAGSCNRMLKTRAGCLPENVRSLGRKRIQTVRIELDWELDDCDRLVTDARSQSIWEDYIVQGNLQSVHGSNSLVRQCRRQRGNSSGEYVVKTIIKSKFDDVRLEREIRYLRLLDHPNIVHLVDVYEDEHCVHIVTPLSKGGNLAERATRRMESGEGFDEREIAFIAFQLLSALAHCHSMNIAHRDIKLENITFDSDEKFATLQLIDFGFGKELGELDSITSNRHSVVGSLFYLAPDTVSGVYSTKVDIWGVGIVVHILMCGKPVFDGYTEEEVLGKIRNYSVLSTTGSQWKHMSFTARRFLGSLLCKDENLRPTAQEALGHPWLQQFAF
mmetsp:Transcript_24324/g.41819  ORF Transcript_24324/g.41819 Transcript_24324/m.41819 type:complete len:338 (-) Transcript_24324:570-1583(-)